MTAEEGSPTSEGSPASLSLLGVATSIADVLMDVEIPPVAQGKAS